MKPSALTLFIFWLFTGCEDTAPPLQNPIKTGVSRLNDVHSDESCLKSCGIEARNGLYSECLEDGGEQKECGSHARTWYKDCLESRCSAAEIQLDDCRTKCRIRSKADYEQCLSENRDTECRKSMRKNTSQCLDLCSPANVQ